MKTRKWSSGQTLIEFALVFPLLIFLVLGLFDLGRAVFFKSSLSNAVREGSRYAIVVPYSTTGREDMIKTMVIDKLWVKDLKDNANVSVSYNPADPTTGSGDLQVIVDASYDFKPITPGISLIIGGSGAINLKAKSTMLLTPHGRPVVTLIPTAANTPIITPGTATPTSTNTPTPTCAKKNCK